MNVKTQQIYSQIVAFLGDALGPDYEIALHDVSKTNDSIVAISNNHISGRNIGAPLTNKALQLIADRAYEKSDFVAQYSGLSADGKLLRSNTMFIKDSASKLTGLLCINFDDSRYSDICRQVMRLCHPNEFVEHNSMPEITSSIFMTKEDVLQAEHFTDSAETVAEALINQVLADVAIPIDRLTQDEKMDIVLKLHVKGLFMIKGAVQQVSKALHSSDASIYRYLQKAEKTKKSK
jgi:predicted transcriptional regulator YheO